MENEIAETKDAGGWATEKVALQAIQAMRDYVEVSANHESKRWNWIGGAIFVVVLAVAFVVCLLAWRGQDATNLITYLLVSVLGVAAGRKAD